MTGDIMAGKPETITLPLVDVVALFDIVWNRQDEIPDLDEGERGACERIFTAISEVQQ